MSAGDIILTAPNPNTTQPQQRELPEAIEVALGVFEAGVLFNAKDETSDWFSDRIKNVARGILADVIAQYLEAVRADTVRLDAWERERWQPENDDGKWSLKAYRTAKPFKTPDVPMDVKLYDATTLGDARWLVTVGEGPTLRAAIDSAMQREEQP